MADPVVHGRELDAALEFGRERSRRYVEGLSGDYVLRPGTEAAIEHWADPMPEHGSELERAAVLSLRDGRGAPAALGADWLTSAYDQVAYAWASSPFAARLEQVATYWLRQLFELPGDGCDDGKFRRTGGGAQLVG